ncbi:phage tail tape measure protein [Pseudomonas violetae]|uniref:Phage tail tape measure protein n=1 Tax=Pseudomonas violetae TaxID=2915813 RepID=A0ABT0EZI0_9PSED|nr:phage tail tape measure protein [Pseudomonas violetae]MCK1791162.1 phage tail tape measure protein [Pseudomonas violetae]
MSSDLRVALRIQATSGNSRREIQAIERDLRKAGKDGAKALADESGKATNAISKTGQAGAASYKIIRQAMREATTQGSGVFRQGVQQTTSDLKQLGQVGRQAARETKAELVRTAREGIDPLRQSVDRTETSFRRLALNGGRNLRLLKTLATGVREEFNRIKGLGTSVQGRLAGLGVGVGVAAGLTGSARLDRQLIRTQQTAGMTSVQRDEWRQEGFRIAKTYGLDRAGVDSGFNTLIASGVNYDAAKKTADAIGQTTAVSGADSAVLGKATVAGASAFNIDLNKAGAALDLLQKMTVAGRLGNAELENLADLFPKIGGSAQAAGMGLSQALAFVETLSTVEMQPDRLGTLADSTLRVFSVKQYRDQVTKSSGVKFFNGDGSSRNPTDVMGDLKRKYDAMKTDQQRAQFMGTVFKSMDQDTVRGMRIMLGGDRLATFNEQTAKINAAEPVLNRDLKENTESATAVANRMKTTFAEAIDRMAQPLNKEFAQFGGYLLDDLNLSGEQMLGGGLALGAGAYYAGRGATAGVGALLDKFMGGPETLKNIAVGKVLEEATGVTSVFVTNWPNNEDSGLSDLASEADKSKWLAPAVLAFGAMQIGGSSGQQTDEARLAMVPRNKLINGDQRTYEAAFYRNRIDLANKNPEASSDWLSENARRLAQGQTGLTSSGSSVAGANSWATGMAAKLVNAGVAPMSAAGANQAAEQRLKTLLEKPLIIDLRFDSEAFQAEMERRVGIQLRRG